ncbi:hypothetical protein CBL_10655 [Carabus blaptoides fortunei]
MQCLAGRILVILLIQNSLGQYKDDPGCGEKPEALRRLNNAENELERPEEPKKSEDPNDPQARMSMFNYRAKGYYPSTSRGINIIPSSGFMMPSRGGHRSPSMSFHYGMSGGIQMSSMTHSIKYKVNVPIDELIQRFFKLYMEWPAIKTTLEIRRTVSFRDLLRAAINCMYPEWGRLKMNMIFSGINDEIVLKDLFLAIFPSWPKQEIKDIFAPGNTIPLIIRKLLLYLVPDLSPKEFDFIFSTNSVKAILQRICEIMFPFMKKNNGVNIFSIGNSVTDIFDGLLHVFFPAMQQPNPIQMDTVYTLLFPGIAYNITSYEGNLPFLLSQYHNFQSMPMEQSKRENILILILSEWLKETPTLVYELPSPGKDDFKNFKMTFFHNAPRGTIVPQEFQDDNFLRELFTLWTRFVVGRHPHDKQIDLHSIIIFLPKFVEDRIIGNNPTRPTYTPTPAPPTMNEIPSTITISFIENLRDLLPPEMKLSLIELFNLPDKTKSGPFIMKILSDWNKYQLKNRVPLSRLMELILRIVASNWPDAEIEKVVGRNLNLEQILINLFKVMFGLDGPNIRVDGNINTPRFILEMLLKKALPHIPKQDIEAVVYIPNDMEQVTFRLMQLLYPNWPLYNPSSSHFDPEVLQKIIAQIIIWPRMKSTIIASDTVFIPLTVERFIRTIFPDWPQYIVSMIIVGRAPLPLIVQKILQMIATNHEDKEIVLHYDEQSPMIQISEALFRLIFPDWPNYSAVLNISRRRERNSMLSQSLPVVYSTIANQENSLKCLNDRDNNWAFALFIGLLKYVQKESLG